MPHAPVMVSEILEILGDFGPEWIHVEATLGYGGHASAIARKFGAGCMLIGIDRDDKALSHCKVRFEDAPFKTLWFHGGFEDLDGMLESAGVAAADSFLFDLGFSSPQVDEGERGFSFMRDAKLDMRMDVRQSFTAHELINTWSDAGLADIFKRFGEERFSRRIARAIVKRRRESPVETTQELADLIIQAIPEKYRRTEGIHPATKVFQAIRIVVNDELESLRKGLEAAFNRLKPGGRVAVVSYHSLEHRVVKDLFHRFCGHVALPPWAPHPPDELKPKGRILTRKAVTPCAAELSANRRSRSAQLRAIEKTPEP